MRPEKMMQRSNADAAGELILVRSNPGLRPYPEPLFDHLVGAQQN
jgi:hypothetical protein